MTSEVSRRQQAESFYGALPESFRVLPFNYVTHIRNGQVDPTQPEHRGKPLIAPDHIESGTGKLLGIESADDQGAESGKYPVEVGDVVYSKIRPALRKVTISPVDGLCSADMYAIKTSNQIIPRFLFWLILSEGFSQAVVLESMRVAMPKVNRETLGAVLVCFPSIPKQRAIADFLDKKTAAIDALIAKKERLTELLQEKRQALITQAVTKGLDPNVPMKDSGVEWLGEIPTHWQSQRVKRLVGTVEQGGAHSAKGNLPKQVSGECSRLVASMAASFERVRTSICHRTWNPGLGTKCAKATCSFVARVGHAI